MKVEERRTMEKIIRKETAGERWSNSHTWPQGQGCELHVLILEIDCIDFIPLMW